MPIQVIPAATKNWDNLMESFSRTGNAWADVSANAEKRKLQQENDKKIAEKLGIDPAILKDPDARKEVFKNAFKTEKPLNPLQKSQKEWVDQKLKYANELQGNVAEQEEQPELQENIPITNEDLSRLGVEEKPKPKSKKPKGIADQDLISEEEIQKAALVFPAVASQMQHHNDKVLAERRHREEMEFKKSEAGKKYEWNVHLESQKYDEELENNARIAKKQILAVKEIEKAVESGNVKPSSWANIFKGFGKVGDKLSEALLTGDEASLLASIPQLLEGWKQVFGVRLSDADLSILQDKLPSLGKSPEANRAVLKIMNKYADQTLLREKIASQVKSETKGLRPLGYSNIVEKKFDEMTSPVKIRNPRTKNVIEIPAYKVSDFIEDGGVIVNE